MNMISTGTFLPEMDASNKQETLAEKFAAVWEKKNSKAAKAGGVSLMALSLAACGSSSDTTTAVEEPAVEEPVVEEPVVEEPTTPVVNELALTTSSSDDLEGTAGADSITGAVSALSAVRTLQATDAIDGGEGSDSIDIQLDAAFTGFTTGSMAAVETVNITNSGSVARNFDGTGTTGVEAFNLTGAVNLSDVAAIATVTAGARTADLSIVYAAAAVTGSSDVQTLSITDFGTADDASTTSVDETAAVAITLAGVETTDLTVSGVNVVDLNGVASKALTATGSGSLEITDIDAATKTIDASGVTGAVTISDTATPTVMTSIKTGAGDDSVTISDLSADVAANATISGGDGDDTLVITAGNTTTQLAQTGFETMNFGAVGGATTMSMTNASGVTTLIASKTMDDDVTLSSVGAQAMTINAQGANANSKVLASDHTGATTVSIDTPASTATATARSANKIDVTVSKSTSVDLDVAAKMDWDGTLTAAKAESVVVSIDGGTTANAAIVAAAATSLTVDSVAAASTLTLTAGKATELTISGAKALNTGTHSLDAVEYLTLAGAGGGDLDGAGLDGIVSIDSTTTGDVDFATLGTVSLDNSVTVGVAGAKSLSITDTKTNGQNITITATDIVGAVDVDDIDATTASGSGDVSLTVTAGTTLDLAGAIQGDDVTLDLDGVVGAITYTGDITVKGDLDISMSQLNANDMDGTGAGSIVLNGAAQSLAFTGGLLADTILVTDAATTSSITVTGDLGIGTDKLTVDGSNSTVAVRTIDITGLSNYDAATIDGSDVKDTIKGGAGADTITGGKGDDTISLGASDTKTDVVVLASTAANNGEDTITQFEAGTDDLDLQAFEGVGTMVNADGATDAWATGEVFYLFDQAAGAADSVAATITAVNAAMVLTDTAQTAMLVISDDNSTSVYAVTGDGQADEATGDTFTLMATVDAAITAAGDLII